MRSLSLAALAALALLCFSGVTSVRADTPANCSYSDFLGSWTYSMGPAPAPPTLTSLDCSSFTPTEKFEVTLSFPNVAKGSDGSVGNWTLIYNQGVEVWLSGRVWFAFSAYTQTESLCEQTTNGWVHDMQVQNWMCFSGVRTGRSLNVRGEEVKSPGPASLAAQSDRLFLGARVADPARLNRLYKPDSEFLRRVNEAAGGMFTVGEYASYEGKTIGELERQRGMVVQPGAMPPLAAHLPPTAKPLRRTRHHRHAASAIPTSFDWRNVNGENFVSPVRNQGSCGSCYAFASAGMMEARIRVMTNNRKKPVISTQDIVSCSNYAQGCEGGFPYLIAGKYGHDFGLVEEDCYPYKGVDSPCKPDPEPGCNSTRWFTREYYYIGGYYGKSTVQLMQEEIMANGPIAVSFEVYDDFQHYTGGVYTHKFARSGGLDDWNPFELTNHVVVIVGWGVTSDAAAVPYWIVKNSWGEAWGEQGYFRILRGSTEPGGECAIESLTVSAIPIND